MSALRNATPFPFCEPVYRRSASRSSALKLRRMLFWLRPLLICLLAMALPLQGTAAAAMLNCGSSHHHVAVGVVDPAGAMPAAPKHHLPSGYVGHIHAQATSPAGEPATQAHASTHADHASAPAKGLDAPGHLGKSKCSACAACCTGLALPMTLPRFNAAMSSERVSANAPTSLVVFLTDGPERPPRRKLA